MIKLNKSFKNTFKEYQFICYNHLRFLQCDIFVKNLILHFNSFIKIIKNLCKTFFQPISHITNCFFEQVIHNLKTIN